MQLPDLTVVSGAPWLGHPFEEEEESKPRGDGGAAVGVHLVGSIPLGSAEAVFRRSAETLGDRLRRMPDGETGPRSDWILWQYPVFSSRPQFVVGPPGDASYRTLPKLRLRQGESAHSVSFDGLGYAETAIASYRLFARLKRDGVVPGHCRFQLCLPTPLAPISAFVHPADQAELEPIYEARMLAELAQILAAVPADQLAVQWDARVEFAMLDGFTPAWFTEIRAGILERLLRLSRHVPSDVELGFHLCYGDEAHGHFVKLEDSGKLVEILFELHRSVSKPLPNSLRRTGSGDFTWPRGFAPVPDEEWTGQPIDDTALAYDHVEKHGWYSNLDLTVEELACHLRDGDILLDYSGGTGILLDRARLRIFERQVGWLIVDASAKFLRVAVPSARSLITQTVSSSAASPSMSSTVLCSTTMTGCTPTPSSATGYSSSRARCSPTSTHSGRPVSPSSTCARRRSSPTCRNGSS